MPVRQHEWTQDTWTRAKQDTYDAKGDFYDLVGLYPNRARTKLKRAPAWGTFCTTWPSDFIDPEGAVYDSANGYFVFFGEQQSDGHLCTAHYESDWTAHGPNDLTLDVSTYGALCGLSQRNIHYWGDRIYLLTDNFDLYATTGITTAPAKLWDATGGLGGKIIFPYGDRMYMVDNQGTIYKLNADADGLDTYYTPTVPLDIRYATAFHQYLCLICRAEGGALSILRLPDVNPYIIHEVARLEGITGEEPYTSPFTDGSLYLTHGDNIYFTSGWYAPTDTVLDLYSYNGAYIEHVARVQDLPALADIRSAGLALWHDELLLWYVRTDSTNHDALMLVGDGFTTFMRKSGDHYDESIFYVLAGQPLLLVRAKGGASDGFFKTVGLQDGYLVTGALDFDRPGRKKRLNRITVLTDTADSDLDLLIKYRTDDDGSWTTAATSTNTRINQVDPVGVEFYRVQFRLEFVDNSSGGDIDAGIDKLSVLYSVND